MNKNVKRIVALALAIGTVSAAAPAANINLLTTKAYAATTNSTSDLTSLELEKSSGSDIQLYTDSDCHHDDKIDDNEVKEGETYYAKASSNRVKVKTDGPDDKYVRIFKGTSSSTKGKEEGDSISLSSGTTTLVVRIYNSEPDSDVRYEDDNDVIGTYKIRVKCTSSDDDNSSDDSDSYDDIYLDKLSIDGHTIDLSKSKTTYNYDVASDVDEVTIKAVPDEDDYTVKIDGDEVNEDDDKYKRDVTLSKGENEIKVRIEDDNDERVYTLKINRGGTSSTAASNSDDNDKYDHIYLDSLSVEGDSIDLSKSKTVYTYSVSKDTDEVTIKAEPEDNDYDVEIDGDEVNEDDDRYKNDVSLNKGENDIKVKIEDGSDERVYTLKIYRGTAVPASSSTSSDTTGINTATSTPDSATTIETASTAANIPAKKIDQWVQVNGGWQYNDSLGNPIRNQWFYDRNLGKWYYLYSDGMMAVNTTIGAWRVGYDGAWIR